MIALREPGGRAVRALVDSIAGDPYTYPHVGATRGELPPDYAVDRNATRVGRGKDDFERAKAAIADWVPFRMPWIRVHAQGPPGERIAVAVVARVLGLWWTNVSRVVYTIDEPARYGFAYGTLGHHAESGEERFLVSRDLDSDEVTYSILAFSRPRHPLARLGGPLARTAQRRFAADSLEAMRRAVRGET